MVISLLLSLILVLSTVSMAAPTVSYEYGDLLLAFQWPPSYCFSTTRGIRCDHIPLEFIVHGLWPHPPNSNRFFKCPANPNIKLDYRQISSHLLKGLEIYWPNLNSLKYPEFLWDHEYEYHGYCFTRFRNPEVYFQTGLDIATKVIRNIMPTITMRLRSGQTGNMGLHHVEDFRQVTIDGRKLILGLRCNDARNSAIPQLLDLVFCTDTNGNLKNCTFVDKCYNQWMGPNGVVRGWFQIPEVQASLSGFSRSPLDMNPVPLLRAIAP